VTRAGRGRATGALLLTGCLAAACGGGTAGDGAPGAAGEAADGLFRDVTSAVGVDFVHVAGATGRYYFPEIMGAGVGLFDYDGDGDLDLYLVQSGWVMPADAPAGEEPRNRLYRNDLELGPDGRRRLRFSDVTEELGVGDAGYGMGCAVGDYDGDGDPDLYVTNYGPNVLYRNDAGAGFTDVTDAAGVGDPRWSVSASFLDHDGDGDLDLFHVNYVAFADDVLRECTTSAGDREYCTPLAYRPLPDVLYENQGDGTFRDVSAAAGIAAVPGNGLGVAVADFDRDGRQDVYVANDAQPNRLWMNQGNGTFADRGLLSGSAVNAHGAAEAGMGVSVADFDQDGDEDIFVVHLFGETNTLYVNDGKGIFDDRTFNHGLGAPSRSMTGFGTRFFDYDNDGWLDLCVANGAVAKVDTQLDEPWPYKMSNQLFRGAPGGRFEDVSAAAGPAFAELLSSRGAAFGDLDLDGDVDLVVNDNNGPARVLENRVGARNHWLRVALEGPGARVLGATVRLVTASGLAREQRYHTDGSYGSASDARITFGLGGESAPVELTVRWPDGTSERWPGVAVDREVRLAKGAGQ